MEWLQAWMRSMIQTAESDYDANRVGVSIGSGIGGLYNIENTRDTFIKVAQEKFRLSLCLPA